MLLVVKFSPLKENRCSISLSFFSIAVLSIMKLISSNYMIESLKQVVGKSLFVSVPVRATFSYLQAVDSRPTC